ncbi:MAG: type II toxin-antitoxin system RelE/ParE family toxin [Acidobacteriota bacterium]
MKPIQLSEPASAELTDAISWYERQRAGLGGDLFDALIKTIDLIQTHPEIGTLCTTRRPSRQLLVTGFPYSVVYRIRDDDIYVVAVAHTSRRPNYWKHRA